MISQNFSRNFHSYKILLVSGEKNYACAYQSLQNIYLNPVGIELTPLK
jgi:hypothetical protein